MKHILDMIKIIFLFFNILLIFLSVFYHLFLPKFIFKLFLKHKLIFIIAYYLIITYTNASGHLGDTSKVLALNKESFDLVYNQTELAKKKAFQALQLAKSIPYPFGEAQAYSRIGIVFDVLGKYDSALYYYQRSLKVHVLAKNKKGQGAALCNIGLLYLNLNQYQEALSNLHAAIKPLEEVKAYLFLGNCYNNIGLLYNELDNFERALSNYKLALFYYEQLGEVYQKANVISNMAIVYSDFHQADKAIKMELEAIELFRQENDFYNLGKNYNNLAIQYKSLNRKSEAEKAFLESIGYAIKAENISGLADTYMHLATFYSNLGQPAKSAQYTKWAYPLSRQIESPKTKADIFYNYSRICYAEGKYRLASDLLLESSNLKDSIFKSETTEKIALQEARFGLERKENENKQLKQKNRIQNLELTNKLNEIKIRKASIYLLIGFSGLLILLTVVYLKRRYTLQKLRDKTAHQDEQHKQRIHISHELHDNAGAQLTYIVSNLAILEENEPNNVRIKSISDMSKQAILTLRDTVWALNNDTINISVFSDKVKQYCSKITEFESNFSVHIHEKIEEEYTLKPLQALNLFRIFQEAFGNACKHAEASHIDVTIEADKAHQFAIKISDNGKGFNPTEAKKKGHYGMDSMQIRANELDAQLHINSNENQGSSVGIYLNLDATK